MALGILGVLVTLLYGTFDQSAKAARTLAEERVVISQVREVVTLLSDQLSAAYWSSDRPESSFFEGSPTTLEFRFLMAGGLAPGVLGSDLRTARYEVVRQDGVLLLYSEQSEAGAEQAVLIEELIELDFQYFDGEDWVEYWEAQEGSGLPQAVSLRLVMLGPRGQDEYRTAFRVALGRSRGS